MVPAEKSNYRNQRRIGNGGGASSSSAEARLLTTTNQSTEIRSAPSMGTVRLPTTNESETVTPATPAKPETQQLERRKRKVQLADSTVHMSEKTTITGDIAGTRKPLLAE